LCGVSPLLFSFAAEAFSPERSILAYEGRDDRAPDGPQENPSVARSEEEAHVGVREREAGRVNVRKSVHTEREVVRVPKRREEIDIERVPAVGEAREASGATEEDIGEDEMVLQIFEEEVVVTKRVVLKEEVRLRKRVVEDEETVEVDLRKEEVEIDDQSGRGGPQGPLAQERE
jgi:uncharacterized protein (TIGR02271 family)